MIRVNFCPDDCKYMSPKECEQVDKRFDHFCRLFNVRLFHGMYHPKLIQYEACHMIVKAERIEV
jgi:hypothetical protein